MRLVKVSEGGGSEMLRKNKRENGVIKRVVKKELKKQRKEQNTKARGLE